MTDKYHSDTQEKIETISYAPLVQNTNDLEAATKTITAIAEATGVGNADYNKVLTLAKPADARMEVKRTTSRLAVTIDSMTAGTLFCRVYVDAQATSNRLFDLSWTAAGAELSAVDTCSTALATIFNLQKDGSAHTFYFFFWVDAGNAVISLVQLWEGVGSHTASPGNICLNLNFAGLCTLAIYITVNGTGTPYGYVYIKQTNYVAHMAISGHTATGHLHFLNNHNDIGMAGTVSTDLNNIYRIEVNLRSEQ